MGLHQSHVWSKGNGNALNAAKAAESQTNTVHTISHLLQLWSDTLTTLKVTRKRKSIFSGIDLTGQPNGSELLTTGGISKLYHLIYDSEDVEENGLSWGFIYSNDKIMLAHGMLPCTNPKILADTIY